MSGRAIADWKPKEGQAHGFIIFMDSLYTDLKSRRKEKRLYRSVALEKKLTTGLNVVDLPKDMDSFWGYTTSKGFFSVVSLHAT